METTGPASAQEARRRLAVARVNEGWSQKDVAAFLGVSTRAVGKWMAAYRDGGEDGLGVPPPPGGQAQAVEAAGAGRPRLDGQEPPGLRLPGRPLDHPAAGRGHREAVSVRFNSNYLAEWLTRRGLSPQKPEVRAVERDEPAIARWVAEEWPRIRKRRGRSGRTSS